jgi:hypothetical protein
MYFNLLQGIKRESRNVLELMRVFNEDRKNEEEEGQKSAINGEVENGDDTDCGVDDKSQPKVNI